jgi:hypothetical protein
MRVRAKRLGWNEGQLTPEQTHDLDPYDHADDDLEGELVERSIPPSKAHPRIEICLVGGQEADPRTIEEV